MRKITHLHSLSICIAVIIFITNSHARSTITTKEEDELRIHHLPVGAGTCTLVECPGKNATNMLIDCGSFGASSRTDTDLDEKEVEQYIINNIPNFLKKELDVIISHPDQDHYNYLSTVLKDKYAHEVWLGGIWCNYKEGGDNGDKDFLAWLSKQEKNDVKIIKYLDKHWHRKLDTVSCGDADVSVLTVNSSDKKPIDDRKNGNSLVLAVNYENFSAIFPGDAEGVTERKAISNYGSDKLDVDLLSASHHGASTEGSNGIVDGGPSSKWHETTLPEIVIYSAGTRYLHPKCEVLKQYEGSLKEANPHYIRCGDSEEKKYKKYETRKAEYVTEMNGAIIVTTDGKNKANVLCMGENQCNDDVIFEPYR